MIRAMPVVLLALAAAVVIVRGSGPSSATQEREVPALSPFSRAKADYLIRERLPCLGCHQLDGEGGRIGADLSGVGTRRSAAYIASRLRNPQRTVPGTVMPKVPMTPTTRTLVVRYLAGRDGGGAAVDSAPGGVGPRQEADGSTLYAHFCAPCHGALGGGDGYNARYLPVSPTVHADSAYMATRSDDVLYDAIFAGGYVMNRSHRMPGFGQTLSPTEIGALVRHLRTLCNCEGPAWSRDNLSRAR